MVSVGLFQWDLTCITNLCAQSEQNQNDLFAGCGLLTSGEIDGIALATHWELSTLSGSDTYRYGVIFSGKANGNGDTVITGLVKEINAAVAGNPYCFKFVKSISPAVSY